MHKMPYTRIVPNIKLMSLSHIFPHGIFLNKPVRHIIVLILQIMKLVLKDAKDHRTIKLKPIPSLVLAVLLYHALHRKLWEQRKISYLIIILTDNRSSCYWVLTICQALHMLSSYNTSSRNITTDIKVSNGP